jgi:uncharacterized protein YggE
MKLVGIAVLGAVLATAAALSGVGRPQDARGGSNQTPSTHTITVTGTGSVRVVPDRALFSFGVTTQADTASRALGSNATLARKVIAALKAAGVSDADVQTQTVFLAPRLSDDGSAIVGYTATNSVSATLRDLSKAGSIVDAAVAAGANEVSGPSLTRSDETGLYRTALRMAMADAKGKAQSIAKASGAGLGAVSSVVESSGGPVPLPMAKAADAGVESTPVEPGTQTVDAMVTVEFVLG